MAQRYGPGFEVAFYDCAWLCYQGAEMYPLSVYHSSSLTFFCSYVRIYLGDWESSSRVVLLGTRRLQVMHARFRVSIHRE